MPTYLIHTTDNMNTSYRIIIINDCLSFFKTYQSKNVFDRTNVFKFLYTYTFAASQAQRYQFHYNLSTY